MRVLEHCYLRALAHSSTSQAVNVIQVVTYVCFALDETYRN